MLRLLSDENLDGDLVRGLLLREPALDLVRAQDVGLMGIQDPDVLAWAAENDRIVVTHGRTTMPGFAYDRVNAGEPMPGVFVVSDQMPIRQAIEDLLAANGASEQSEWSGLVLHLPL
jgi:hypothetical protein